MNYTKISEFFVDYTEYAYFFRHTDGMSYIANTTQANYILYRISDDDRLHDDKGNYIGRFYRSPGFKTWEFHFQLPEKDGISIDELDLVDAVMYIAKQLLEEKERILEKSFQNKYEPKLYTAISFEKSEQNIKKVSVYYTSAIDKLSAIESLKDFGCHFDDMYMTNDEVYSYMTCENINIDSYVSGSYYLLLIDRMTSTEGYCGRQYTKVSDDNKMVKKLKINYE